MACSEADVERLFTQHYAWLCRLSVRMLRDRGLAEQVVMDVFLELHARRATIDVITAGAWLRQSVVNRTRSFLTRAGKERDAVDRATREGFLPGNDELSARLATRVAEREYILAVLETLPVQQKTALVLQYYADLPEKEIAEIMSLNVGTVKSYLSRAREKLRRELDRHGDAP